jgi:hypothetical protein
MMKNLYIIIIIIIGQNFGGRGQSYKKSQERRSWLIGFALVFYPVPGPAVSRGTEKISETREEEKQVEDKAR